MQNFIRTIFKLKEISSSDLLRIIICLSNYVMCLCLNLNRKKLNLNENTLFIQVWQYFLFKTFIWIGVCLDFISLFHNLANIFQIVWRTLKIVGVTSFLEKTKEILIFFLQRDQGREGRSQTFFDRKVFCINWKKRILVTKYLTFLKEVFPENW